VDPHRSEELCSVQCPNRHIDQYDFGKVWQVQAVT
jgi:hypothetical protein